jgi:hypothetical protein
MHRIVIVEWVDSAEPANNSDIEPADFPAPQSLTNTGYLVEEHDSYIVVAGAMKSDPSLTTYDYVIAIPRVAIRSIGDLAPVGDVE